MCDIVWAVESIYECTDIKAKLHIDIDTTQKQQIQQSYRFMSVTQIYAFHFRSRVK